MNWKLWVSAKEEGEWRCLDRVLWYAIVSKDCGAEILGPGVGWLVEKEFRDGVFDDAIEALDLAVGLGVVWGRQICIYAKLFVDHRQGFADKGRSIV